MARTGIISAWRGSSPNFPIEINYSKIPDDIHPDGIAIIADPMLATGHTLLKVAKKTMERGTPERLVFFSVISTKKGIDHVAKEFPEAELTLCPIDPKVDGHGYIVPGLGDAGTGRSAPRTRT